ncbi:HNH endonuclease [Pseudomonas moorei]|uniref:HNH endonuclease n=1 Tax=Pseudomonas moorei TaxID=395599 RepID=UPI00200F5642|nr:HNH endonuclease [Pseudomonas moorei]
MSECVLCETPLDSENDSEEHIVINAIGGRYKVPGVLCVKCNNGSGQIWDSALAKDLQSLGLLIGVKRERGELPSLRVKNLDGDELLLHADGSMSPAKVKFCETEDSSGSIKIELTARNSGEARKILKGVKKKYPKLDVELAVSEADEQLKYSTSPLDFSMGFGGPLSGRSLVKSVLCFAAVNGVSPGDCFEAKNYLLQDDGDACFGYWYERDIILDRPLGTPFHCIAVSNIATDGQLLGYVEFFGVRRMVVCLAKNYIGPPIYAVYCIDPRTSQQLTVQCDLKLSRDDIKAAFDYQRIPDGSVQMAFDPILREALRRSSERERERAINRAVEYAFKNCGAEEGGVLTEENVKKLAGLLSEKLRPYLEHVLVKPPRGSQG